MNPLILYDNALTRGTLSSTSLATGFNVQSIKDQRPFTQVKFAAAGSANYIQCSFDAAEDIDCFAVVGHNLYTIGASLQLQGSNNGSDWNPITGGSKTPTDDNPFMLKFTKVTVAYLKIVISNTLGLPYLGTAFAAEALQMEQTADGPRIPYSEGIIKDSETSKDGNPLGTVLRYNPVTINHTYSNLTRSWIKSDYKPFWDNSGKLGNWFFYCTDLTNDPDEVFYCQFTDDARLETPQSILTYADSLQLNMLGVR